MHYKFVLAWGFIASISALNVHSEPLSYDLTVVGPVRFADGIGRQSIELIDTLKAYISINFIPTLKKCDFTDVPLAVKRIMLNQDITPGRVAIFEQSIAFGNTHKLMPRESIKIAYSMVEGSQVPRRTVNIINQWFDAVVVPSEFLIDVYQKSGVKKPVFYLPLGIYLDDFFKKKASKSQKKLKQKTFIFGSTSGYVLRKEYFVLVEAFAKEFGNRSDVILKINGRKQNNSYFPNLKKFVKSLHVSNIHLSEGDLSWSEYVNFMASFDCLVNLSMGEGYSIVPREAMALGIPCVLSNNTGQKVLCDSGFVCSVPSTIPVKAEGPTHAGVFFASHVDDVRKALRNMYDNYALWFNEAQKNRLWVSQFTWKSLQKKYLNLVKPKQLILGNKNEITDEYLETKCSKLFARYKALR